MLHAVSSGSPQFLKRYDFYSLVTANRLDTDLEAEAGEWLNRRNRRGEDRPLPPPRSSPPQSPPRGIPSALQSFCNAFNELWVDDPEDLSFQNSFRNLLIEK